MYVSIAGSLAEDPTTTPKAPTTLRMRPVPYLCLDRFPFDKSTFTKRLDGMVDGLAAAVTRSWATSQPITSIRLVGHTDSTGTEVYNVGLGDRRAGAVEVALRKRLGALASRVKISTQKSPGKMEPRRDNSTADGREVNRRVEVFVTVTPRPTTPTTPSKPFKGDVTLPPDSVIVTKPDPYSQPIPGGPKGRSLQDWLDEKLRGVRPSWLRTGIRDAIVGGSCAAASALLDQANLPGADRDELETVCKKMAEAKAK